MYIKDTIAAVATPPGTGGVGIVRVSGEDALPLAGRLFKGKKTSGIEPRVMYYGDFCDEKDGPIDTGFFAFFKGPKSFTGEDVVEFHCHGGIIIIQRLLKAMFKLGIRPAEPGEFSKRAFLNGKIDLVQAESISDLISAESNRAAEIARDHYRGNLSSKIEQIRDNLASILAWLEAEIDYPEADIDQMGRDRAISVLQEQAQSIEQLKGTYSEGKIYRDGIITVILGQPNVGKSSLLNLLAGEDRAIVTDIPGTTRDVLEVPVTIRGIPLRLADTAGIRDSLDKVEQIGVQRARNLASRADLTLLVMDMSRPLTDDDLTLLGTVNKAKSIIVLNKGDLPAQIDSGYFHKQGFGHVKKISVLHEQGIEDLKQAIEDMFVSGEFNSQNTLITNERHYLALEKASDLLLNTVNMWDSLPSDLLALDLRDAWSKLGEVTGSTWSDDLLSCIFQRFCLGK